MAVVVAPSADTAARMIGKVITLNKTGSTKRGFGPVVTYITRDDRDLRSDGPTPNIPPELGLINLEADIDTVEDRALVAELMNATAAQARKRNHFRGNPVYHVALNWMGGEHPSTAQVDAAVKHLMQAVGLHDCEALWALHRDTDYDHVHVVMNRIHPETGRVVGPGPYDYFKIDKACREIELAQGWQHAPGPYVVEQGRHGPEIVRRSRRERNVVRPTQKAQRAARNQAAPSFQEWVTRDPARAIQDTLHRPGATWTDVHQTLADYGAALTTKGSGLIVTTILPEGRILAAKASQLGRECSKARMEQRFGPFQSHPDSILNVPTHETYTAFVARVQRDGVLGNPEPADGSRNPSARGQEENPERALRRLERAQARHALYRRFKIEQETLKLQRRAARKDLAERHRRERVELKETLALRRTVFRAEQQIAGVPTKLITALWAFEAARAREGVQKRHATERPHPGGLPKGVVWRNWLEQQASHGDEAAKSALRGIRYHEQRKQNQSRNGLDGEDLDPLKPVLSSLHTEIDPRRQRVHYRDAHGQILFTDTGPRIEVHDTADTSLEAALRVAAQKFGGRVDITGSVDFRERATRVAARLGIGIRDSDLQPLWQQEREQLRRVWPEGRARARDDGREL
ncbi:MAG: TraI/MobA(P) family conjugative relaxase [Acidiferrobacteraceae bacterium]